MKVFCQDGKEQLQLVVIFVAFKLVTLILKYFNILINLINLFEEDTNHFSSLKKRKKARRPV